jgi:hypothetical protein
MTTRLEVAAVIKKFGKPFIEQHTPNTYQIRTLRALRDCRTEALGGHKYSCTNCGHTHISYNSCRNRHCPKCQGEKREQWIQARSTDLLPVPYYHIVFTLPDTLNQFCLQYPKEMYDQLFKCVWDTLYLFALDHQYMGAMPGMIAILHTWGQTLSLHPHLHCIMPAGGISISDQWVPAKHKEKYLFPVKAMSVVFRGKYMDAFKRLCNKNKIIMDKKLINQLYKHQWVVYSKAPYKSVYTVVEYLARYTHRIAITNYRIKAITESHVAFAYKDYRDGNKQKQMQLTGVEFLRRFSTHILPKGFVRTRHYGFLGNAYKQVLAKIKAHLKVPIACKIDETKSKPIVYCPLCKHEMICVEIHPKRGPPIESYSWKNIIQSLNR